VRVSRFINAAPKLLRQTAVEAGLTADLEGVRGEIDYGTVLHGLWLPYKTKMEWQKNSIRHFISLKRSLAVVNFIFIYCHHLMGKAMIEKFLISMVANQNSPLFSLTSSDNVKDARFPLRPNRVFAPAHERPVLQGARGGEREHRPRAVGVDEAILHLFGLG